jgi:hypothetical protein
LKAETMTTRLALIILGLLAMPQAHASTRSYFTPMADGQRVGACLSDGATCGKVVADQFCQREGFAESILFSREAVASAWQMDSGKLCEGPLCQAFTRIKCFQPPKTETQAAADLP